jgi:uroporphyrinogen decarboxylase
MEGLELIRAVFERRATPRAPWVPFAGVHAGKLIGTSPKEVLTNSDTLVKALLEANRLYAPDGQPVFFDLQLEAEILGCPLAWSENNPPSVAGHPLADIEQDIAMLPRKIPAREDGRLPVVLDAMRRMKTKVGGRTALYGLVTGPFTLASHLRGTDIFLDLIMNPDYAHALLEYCLEVARVVAGYYIEAGMDVIAAVDPLISQISPVHFAEFMADPFSRLFSHIRNAGVYSSFFVCGNATANIEPMCLTKPDCISVDENVNLATAKEITDRYGIVIGGNLPLTTIMLFGTQQDNMKAVLDLARDLSPGGWVVSPGCDMPYDTPIENCIAAGHAVREPAAAKSMIEGYSAADLRFTGELPKYAELARPLVEVYTLDSASCAACTYMMATAVDALKQVGGAADLVEYKYSVKENIARCRAVGVKNLPSLYIDGELIYSSLIPAAKDLADQIRARAPTHKTRINEEKG